MSSDLVGNFAAEVQQAQGIDSFHPSEKPKMAGTPASSPRRKTTPGGPWVFDGFLMCFPYVSPGKTAQVALDPGTIGQHSGTQGSCMV